MKLTAIFEKVGEWWLTRQRAVRAPPMYRITVALSSNIDISHLVRLKAFQQRTSDPINSEKSKTKLNKHFSYSRAG